MPRPWNSLLETHVYSYDAIEYPRGGGLIERLRSWQGAVEVIGQETRGLAPTEYVIVDPDSRLTQLGLLPLVADERPYLFFESRSYRAAELHKLGALTAHWMQQVFGMTAPFYPYCAPSQPDVAAATAYHNHHDEVYHGPRGQRQPWRRGQPRETASRPIRVSAAGSASVRGGDGHLG